MATKPKLNFHIVVIENVKNQPSIDPGECNFDFSYLQNETPLSLSENINKAFSYQKGEEEYFCVLNPDIVFQGEVFSTLISAMQKFQIDIIAPIIMDSKGKVQDSFRPVPTPIELILRYLRLKRTVYDLELLPPVIYPDWIGGMFMLMPTGLFEKVGGFNPTYKLYFEDVDFCLRAKQLGLSIGVLKKVRVLHDAQRSSRRIPAYFAKHVTSAIKFFRSDVYHNYRNS